MEFKNADELRNGCPDLVKEIVDEAHAAVSYTHLTLPTIA